ncbi:MAG: class D sortase [Ruminococcus sp.]|nr:class D sortase [Ruminococcus sp.]
MSNSDTVKGAEQTARVHKTTSSSRVLRTFTYVLTPFLILCILCSIGYLALYKPYNEFISNFNYVFSDVTPETKSLRTLNKYRDDDAPIQMHEIEVEVNGKTEQHTMVYPYYGDYYATLNCEAAGMKDIPVYSGQADDILMKGAGWYNASSYIGKPGNVVIAGHNHTDFYYLPNCKVGDTVTLETVYVKITYEITERVIFHETDYTYVEPTEDDRLTLYTCWNNGRLGMSEWRLCYICKPTNYEWKEVPEAE